MNETKAPPGWYPDPAGDTTKLRYWDGENWTGHLFRTSDCSSQPLSAGSGTSDEYLCGVFIEGKRGKPKPDMIPKALGQKFGFNVFAFLSGPVYFVYRKCYWEAMAITAIIFATGYLPFDIPALIFELLYGLIFYPLYSMRVKRAIGKARSEGLSEAALQKLRRTGGVNIGATIAATAIYTVFAALVVYAIEAYPS